MNDKQKFRFEFKYYIKQNIYNHLLRDLLVFTDFDKNCDPINKSYKVNSIYLDNHLMRSYRQKISGEKNRTKIRFRTYDSIKKKNFTLELKIRSGDKLKKESTKQNPYKKIINKKNVASRIAYQMQKFENYSKKLLISYDRIALYDKINKQLRITIDSNLFTNRYISSKKFGMKIRIIPFNYKILEIKCAENVPHWLIYLIKKYSLIKNPISKYAISMKKLSESYSLEL